MTKLCMVKKLDQKDTFSKVAKTEFPIFYDDYSKINNIVYINVRFEGTFAFNHLGEFWFTFLYIYIFLRFQSCNLKVLS